MSGQTNKPRKSLRKRVAYSQNFLKDKRLVSKLLAKSSINKNDTVYEIGSGPGIITGELIKVCKGVVAFEIDANLCNELKNSFSNVLGLKICSGDFLSHTLPRSAYKVFSNIPFNITADIIKKLTQAPNPPKDSYLIVQKEAAAKYAGKPYGKEETQISVLIKPWFELTIVYQFKRSDFYPKPKVSPVLLRIRKRGTSLIDVGDRQVYKDFITYAFNQWKSSLQEGLQKVFTKPQFSKLAKELDFPLTATPTQLDFERWLGLFNFFLTNIDNRKQKIVKSFAKHLFEQQSTLQKIHRTRTDKDWRKFKEYYS